MTTRGQVVLLPSLYPMHWQPLDGTRVSSSQKRPEYQICNIFDFKMPIGHCPILHLSTCFTENCPCGSVRFSNRAVHASQCLVGIHRGTAGVGAPVLHRHVPPQRLIVVAQRPTELSVLLGIRETEPPFQLSTALSGTNTRKVPRNLKANDQLCQP